MNDCVQAEMGSASLVSLFGNLLKWSRFLFGTASAMVCLVGYVGSAAASDPPVVEPLPEFAYDVHLAPSVPSASRAESNVSETSSPTRSSSSSSGPASTSTTSTLPAAVSPSAAFGPSHRANRSWSADLIRVYKSERRLVLFANNQPIDEFRIALGSRPIGPKRQKGDGRTPEGRYSIDWRKADSDFYRALHISYPNQNDRRSAHERGVSPGGSIMIHGLPNGLGIIGAQHALADWTDGCIAVTNEEMILLWDRVQDGVPIEIFP